MSNTQTTTQRVGWAILLGISALLVLNGVTWFRRGSAATLAYPLEQEQVTEAEFTREHPVFVEHIGLNAREVAIWYAGFGLMAALVAVEGYRHGTRWAWIAASVIPSVFIVAGLSYGLWLGLGFANAGRVFIGLVALAGLILSRPRRQTKSARIPEATPDADPAGMMG